MTNVTNLPHGSKPAGAAQTHPSNDAAAQHRQDSLADFSWSRDAEDIVVGTQLATAIYKNPVGDMVIRQKADWNDDEDHVVIICRQNCVSFFVAMQRYLESEKLI